MTVNPYFRSNYTGTGEQNLVENLIIESIQIYGIDIEYIPRTLVNYDALFGEDQSSSFTDTYTIEMYVKSVDGFGGDGNLLTRFGLEIRDEVQLTVAKSRFTTVVTGEDAEITRPREGDLIKLPTTVDQKGRLFEISYVNYEEVYYQLGKLYTYEITASVFELGGETFDTGDDTIDSVEDFRVVSQFLLSNGTGDYTVGESVAFSGGAAAIVKTWDATTNILGVHTITSSIALGETVTGGSSSAAYEVMADIGIDLPNGNEDNNTVTDEIEDIIDPDETNSIVT